MTANDNPSPFKRPGFIIAASVVVLLIVAAIALGVGTIIGGNNDDDEPTATPTTSDSTESGEPTETATEEPTESTDSASSESVCGLTGEVLEGRIDEAPEAEWAYTGAFGYPTSDSYGPGLDEPFRHCFQHSPEGAVFMSASTLAYGLDKSATPEFFEYLFAPGEYREAMIADTEGPTSTDQQNARFSIQGFRLLEYTGDEATVDIAWRGTMDGQTITMSSVYPLVWHDGDWKIRTDGPVSDPVQIPDLNGYIAWSE